MGEPPVRVPSLNMPGIMPLELMCVNVHGETDFSRAAEALVLSLLTIPFSLLSTNMQPCPNWQAVEEKVTRKMRDSCE
jgi:hypothetical protein